MQKKKFNFKNIQGMLSRDEMKQIRGGSGSRSPFCGDECDSDSYCQANTGCPRCVDYNCNGKVYSP